ncbi:MAG: hypothetical protein ABSD92_10700 [Candidatus Bathyarchaeia archaeon]
MSKNELNKDKVIGTNCYNCKFVGNKEELIDPKILNNEGGIDPKNEEEMDRAKEADLITLPGGSKADVTNKKLCSNDNIKMYVTVRMCCAYWDNDGVKRPWKKTKKQKK